MKTVVPRPEFQSLSEDAVLAALEDTDPANPVAVELARLIEGYTANYVRRWELLGHLPSEFVRIKPRWPIESVAMRLTTDSIKRSVGKWVLNELHKDDRNR